LTRIFYAVRVRVARCTLCGSPCGSAASLSLNKGAQKKVTIAAAATGGPVSDFVVRPAQTDDALSMAQLYAGVAEEGITATEPPVDVQAFAELFAPNTDDSVVAVADDQLIGGTHTEVSKHGFGKVGLVVQRDWRDRGVGSALLEETIGRARDRGLSKLSCEMFADCDEPIALYHKLGFVDEGRRVKQYRRAGGELRDSVIMGLVL
jgi:putative acetyltransferase